MSVMSSTDRGTIGPVLSAMPADDRPQPLPACATCPRGVWFALDTELRCFCREMRRISWAPKSQPIITCDGHEAALASNGED